ncbi:MAG: hypothetical protein ACOYBV_04920 [Candidatus Avilachnospira sp.]
MKNNRLFKISVAEIVIGLIIELLAFSGIVEDGSVLTGIGSGILAVGVVQLLRVFRMESNPEYKKRMETASKDERYAFISMKAKEAAFGIYLIIAAVLCMAWMLLGYREQGMLAAMSICILVLLYAVLFRILARKY